MAKRLKPEAVETEIRAMLEDALKKRLTSGSGLNPNKRLDILARSIYDATQGLCDHGDALFEDLDALYKADGGGSDKFLFRWSCAWKLVLGTNDEELTSEIAWSRRRKITVTSRFSDQPDMFGGADEGSTNAPGKSKGKGAPKK